MRRNLEPIINIRAFAISLVVIGHGIILYQPEWNLYSTSQNAPAFVIIKKVIDLIQMPLFFSLSGYLFVFSRSKNISICNLMIKKAKRLLIPYVAIGFLYVLPIRLIARYPGYQGITIERLVFYFFTSSDVGHLWFLPTLFVCFFLCQIVLRIAEEININIIRRNADLFLIIVSIVLYLEGYHLSLGYIPLQMAFLYLLWFSFGYCIHLRINEVIMVYSITVIRWCAIVINVLLLVWLLRDGSLRLAAQIGLRMLCLLNIYAIVPRKTSRILRNIDMNSFGIYLFHSPLVYITAAFIPDIQPDIMAAINIIGFGTLAYGITWAVRRTGLALFIGEYK